MDLADASERHVRPREGSAAAAAGGADDYARHRATGIWRPAPSTISEASTWRRDSIQTPRRISNARSSSERRRRRRRRWPIPCTTSARPSREWDGTSRPCSGIFARSTSAGRAGDKRSGLSKSYGIGAIFDYQGRYGAAVKSKEEALKAFRDLKSAGHVAWRDPRAAMGTV